MDLLAGYDSDEGDSTQVAETTPAAPAAAVAASLSSSELRPTQSTASAVPETHTAVSVQQPSVTTAPTVQAAEQQPQPQPHPAHVSGDAAQDEEERARKRQKKEEKKKKKEQKQAASQEPPKPRLVLPSASQMLKGLNATALGLNAPAVVDDDAGSSKPTIDMSKKYNALPPPASLLQSDQGTEEEQWKMKPMNFTEKKRKFTDIPYVTTSSSHSHAAAGASSSTHHSDTTSASKSTLTVAPSPPSASTSSSTSAAPASTLPASTLRRFAPPQLVRKQANISTEDIGNWNTVSKTK